MTDREPEDAAHETDADDLPAMRFDIFVLSLNASALIQLGQAPADSDQAAGHVDLPMAQQTIDILGLLEQKTRGNLSGDEERLLRDILFDLRMRYARARSPSPSPSQGETG
jgi:Domain of unknown function (DUF1844)